MRYANAFAEEAGKKFMSTLVHTVKDHPILLAGLKVISKGKRVFPCVPNHKNPATQQGFHDATLDEATLHQWSTKWPDANLGMPTGEANGLIVLDVDCGDNKDGEAQLAKLLTEHGPLPETLEVRTPRGRHIYFRHPGVKVPSRTNHPLPVIELPKLVQCFR